MCGDFECCDMFKALSVETRVKIIELLKQKGPLGAKKIAETLGITPAAVSQHLKTLRQAGLVRSERRGYWIPYEVDEKAMESCRIELSRVCSCECDSPPTVELRQPDGMTLESLEKYRQELEKHLKLVNRRIKELDRPKKE